MRVTSRGRVTIPKVLRDRFGLLPGDHIDFVVDGNDIYLVKANDSPRSEGTIRARRSNPQRTTGKSTPFKVTPKDFGELRAGVNLDCIGDLLERLEGPKHR